MNEVSRVLKPGGIFYALTPFYPKKSALSDPTHVNLITIDTVKYFTTPHLWAKMYGFSGSFELLTQKIVNFADEERMYLRREKTIKTYSRKLANHLLSWRTKQHLLWVLRNTK